MLVEIDELKRLNCLLQIYVEANIDKDFSILSNDADPFFIMNRDGQLFYVNDTCETLLEYSKRDLLDMKLQHLFVKGDLHSTGVFFFEKESEKLNNFDAQMISHSGTQIDVNVTTFPIQFKGEIIGTYVVLKDITLIKKERRLMSEKQATAGQLAAGIAHEIRNPITAIKGFIQLILDEQESESVYIKIIESEIDRIEEILKELMILAKPTRKKFERLNIRVLLEQVLMLMETQALLNNIEVERKYLLSEEDIHGDANQLKQVFINYIKNAIEAMPYGGKLQIECAYYNRSFVRIKIKDQGCGIPIEIIDRIGDPFFTTKENGTGLGMAVSNQIIQEHKGEMKINSNTEGTCIEVKLPIRLK